MKYKPIRCFLTGNALPPKSELTVKGCFGLENDGFPTLRESEQSHRKCATQHRKKPGTASEISKIPKSSVFKQTGSCMFADLYPVSSLRLSNRKTVCLFVMVQKPPLFRPILESG